mmetsp:Transcript_11166/g.35629  ORF Transcript_11166/g.35629 Transcript_11166/m.35629 type:complete len:355 (-) Transcript_11166:755-1819(-)
MDALDGAARVVAADGGGEALELLVPLDGGGGGARDAGAAQHRVTGGLAREVLLEDDAVAVALLGGRRVDREAVLAVGPLQVGDLLLGLVAEAVDPRVAHAVRKLLLLAPEHLVGQVWVLWGVEGLAQDVLFNRAALLVAGAHLAHLDLGVEVHDVVKELAVEEGHAGLDAKGAHGLVGAQAVKVVQVLELVDGLLVELLLVGGLVEVEVAAERLVGALAGEHHLDAHRLDLAAHEEHGGGGADGGDIVGLEVVDDVVDGVHALLHGEGEAMVRGAEKVGHLLGRGQVGGALEADAERVHARPVHGLLGVAGGHAGDERGVKTTAEEHAPRHVAHHALDNGLFELLPQLDELERL